MAIDIASYFVSPVWNLIIESPCSCVGAAAASKVSVQLSTDHNDLVEYLAVWNLHHKIWAKQLLLWISTETCNVARMTSGAYQNNSVDYYSCKQDHPTDLP